MNMYITIEDPELVDLEAIEASAIQFSIEDDTDIESIAVAEQGPEGIVGKSAYDLAVENGFVGTEAEWVAAVEAARLDAEASAVSAEGFADAASASADSASAFSDSASSFADASSGYADLSSSFSDAASDSADAAALSETAALSAKDDAEDAAAAAALSETNAGLSAAAAASPITGAATKDTPVDADSVAIVDSAAGSVVKRTLWSNIKATLKSYFDTLYSAIGHTHSLDATTDSATRLALTTSERTKLSNTSGTNTGDQNLSGLLVKANNLSDLTNAATARTNLGLGAMAVQSDSFSANSGNFTGGGTAAGANAAPVLITNGTNSASIGRVNSSFNQLGFWGPGRTVSGNTPNLGLGGDNTISFGGGGINHYSGGFIFNCRGDLGAANPGFEVRGGSGGSAIVQSRIRGSASQTADLTQWATSANVVLASVGSGGSVVSTTWLKSGAYTVATVPSASTAGAGSQIYVSNESGGAVIAFSDGTNWRRVTDRAIVS